MSEASENRKISKFYHCGTWYKSIDVFVIATKMHLDCSIRATPEKYEDGVIIPKAHQMSSLLTTLEQLENSTMTGGGRKAWVYPRLLGVVTWYQVVIVI